MEETCGLCGKRTLPPQGCRGLGLWGALASGLVVVSKKLDPGSSMRLPGMTRYIAWWFLFRGWV
ncbi:MAG TPA: hypothetical protein PLC91_00700, partial [Candidatus Cloacimonadota bacterium]|nr:hypothetical protein [Candidatus Cloacimonadota bacterium]